MHIPFLDKNRHLPRQYCKTHKHSRHWLTFCFITEAYPKFMLIFWQNKVLQLNSLKFILSLFWAHHILTFLSNRTILMLEQVFDTFFSFTLEPRWDQFCRDFFTNAYFQSGLNINTLQKRNTSYYITPVTETEN